MDDIRILYRFAGIQDTKTTFVFTDNDIKEESFLEYINNILSSGEVANLFPKDELEEMLNSLTPLFKKKSPRGNPSMDNLYQFFIKQAMNNLHLVLCFSPVSIHKLIKINTFLQPQSCCTHTFFNYLKNTWYTGY